MPWPRREGEGEGEGEGESEAEAEHPWIPNPHHLTFALPPSKAALIARAIGIRVYAVPVWPPASPTKTRLIPLPYVVVPVSDGVVRHQCARHRTLCYSLRDSPVSLKLRVEVGSLATPLHLFNPHMSTCTTRRHSPRHSPPSVPFQRHKIE